MYEEIEHTADLAIKIKAPSLPELFAGAANAVLSISGIELSDQLHKQESISLKASDLETLLVSWLEELIFSIEVNHVGFQNCQVEINEELELLAKVDLVPIKRLQRLIKAVTYHNLSIQMVEQGYETVIVFDV